jgi:hypothetical protein
VKKERKFLNEKIHSFLFENDAWANCNATWIKLNLNSYWIKLFKLNHIKSNLNSIQHLDQDSIELYSNWIEKKKDSN